MQFIAQNSDTLRLYVAEGQINLGQFTILSQAHTTWHDTPVQFGILGASHYVLIELPQIFTEICACTEGHFTSDTRLHLSQWLHPANPTASTQSGDINYTFDVTFHKLGEIVPRDRFVKFPNLEEMVFPPNASDTAHTLIGVQTGANLRTRSIHTYPDENLAVETNSTFSFVNQE